jgi:hypothetical protein
MALTHALTTVGTTATKLSPTTSNFNQYTLIIQNNHASNILYVGADSTVTSSAYGVQLAAGASLSLDDLAPTSTVYVIASAASTPVGTMTITR